MKIAHNPTTGEYLGLQDGQWKPLKIAQNEAGDRLYLGESGWEPLPAAKPRQTAAQPQEQPPARPQEPALSLSPVSSHGSGPPAGQAAQGRQAPQPEQELRLENPAEDEDADIPELPGAVSYAADVIRNTPGSLLGIARGLGHVIMHPGETIDNLGNVVLGYKEKGAKWLNPEEAPGEHEKYADAVNQMVADRYGSLDKAAETFRKDPAGVALDASMILGGGGALLKGVGAAGKAAGATNAGSAVARAGEAVARAGQAVDPVANVLTLGKPLAAPAIEAAKAKLGKVASPEAIYARAMKIPPRSVSKAERDRMIATGLQERIPISESGLAKAERLRGDLGKAVREELRKPEHAGKTIDPMDTAIRAENDIVPYFRRQVSPTADMEAAGKVFDDFLDNHQRPLTLEEAQDLKVGTYAQQNKRAWDDRQGPKVETEKALASALRAQLEEAVPEVRTINQRLAGLKALAEELPNTLNRTGNHSMFNMMGAQGAGAGLGATIAGTPGAIIGWGIGKAASSPRVQSELAFLMDSMRKGYRVSAPVRRWMRRAGIPAKYGSYFEARYGGMLGELEKVRDHKK